MYPYRKMSPEEKEAVLAQRCLAGHPLHEPPHLHHVDGWFLISAATYEHKHYFPDEFDRERLLSEIHGEMQQANISCAAWIILPNHYHLLVECHPLLVISEPLRRVHARSARYLNQRDNTKGRRIWYRYTDHMLRDERHYYTALNYIHNNPVKHGYIERPQEWRCSSLDWYIRSWGIEWMRDVWAKYPIKNYEDKWFEGVEPGEGKLETKPPGI